MRMIDGDALVKHLCEDVALKHFYGRTLFHGVRNLHYLCQFIGKQPTLDAVPVVRCRDCKYYKVEGGQCPADNTGDRYYSWIPDPDWFCADGERSDAGD